MKLTELPYPSRRMPALARNGMVATSQPLAALVGLSILEEGGNAVDAAVATAAALTVVEPTSNGIGGDAFALVWDGQLLHGLNGSGRAPQALSRAALLERGHATMPLYGWDSVTVPGAPAAWRDLHQRFGRLDFEHVLTAAIAIAEDGFPVTPVVSHFWNLAAQRLPTLAAPGCGHWADTFSIRGQGPQPGQLWRSRRMARTLRRIAQSGAEDFYRGELAQRIAEFSATSGGSLTADDLAQHSSSWVAPISTRYRGYDVWELPPSGQGLAALLALNIVEGFELASLGRESVRAYHLQIEAMKLAFADAYRYIADPDHAAVPTAALLERDYAAQRRTLIGDSAGTFGPGQLPQGGTVYLCAVDGDGMMASFIQSNYMGFGSGVVIPDTGIALQNRGAGFTLDPDHPNVLAPGKRPFHTIIPAFLTRDGAPIGPFGVMGGSMQPQGHLQMVLNTVDWQLNPQASLDAPRWQVDAAGNVLLEPEVPAQVVAGLRSLGHSLRVAEDHAQFGRGQIIWRLENGVLVGGSDPRADGLALGF